MTRGQRKIHLAFWILLAPLAIAGVALLIANTPAPTPRAETSP